MLSIQRQEIILWVYGGGVAYLVMLTPLQLSRGEQSHLMTYPSFSSSDSTLPLRSYLQPAMLRYRGWI